MKIYAKQVPPEQQESPLFWGDWPENVYTFGNRHYTARDERLQELRRALEHIADAFEDLRGGYDNGGSLHAAIWYELPREGGAGYNRAERLELVKLAQQYTESPSGSDTEEEALLRALEISTSRAWEAAEIRGCCQGDWQRVIYPAEYGRDWLEEFETEYFNTGEEWEVDVDGCGCFVYVHSWRDDDKRREIADAYGCAPSDVVLLAFDGWQREPVYREVTA